MGPESKVVVAWPEDRLLAGEELQELTEDLSPHADSIDEIVKSQKSYALPEIESECKQAILKTMGHLASGSSHRDLHDIIIGCWDRTSTDEDGKNLRPHTSSYRLIHLLSIATRNLVRNGELSEGKLGWLSQPTKTADSLIE